MWKYDIMTTKHPLVTISELKNASVLERIKCIIKLNNLRWLKPVSTLSRDLVIRMIDTTILYHSAAMFWYHIKHHLLLKMILV